MKRLFLLLNIILAVNLSDAQETYRFSTDAPQGFSVENSTETNLSLHYAITELGITDIDNGEAKGQEIVLKGSFGSPAEGLPNLPFENRYIAVPKGRLGNPSAIEPKLPFITISCPRILSYSILATAISLTE